MQLSPKLWRYNRWQGNRNKDAERVRYQQGRNLILQKAKTDSGEADIRNAIEFGMNAIVLRSICTQGRTAARVE